MREKIAEKVATIYRGHFPHCPNVPEVPKKFGYEVADQILPMVQRGFYDMGYAQAVRDNQVLMGNREVFWQKEVQRARQEAREEIVKTMIAKGLKVNNLSFENQGKGLIIFITEAKLKELGFEVEPKYECPCGTVFLEKDAQYSHGWMSCPSCGIKEDLIQVAGKEVDGETRRQVGATSQQEGQTP